MYKGPPRGGVGVGVCPVEPSAGERPPVAELGGGGWEVLTIYYADIYRRVCVALRCLGAKRTPLCSRTRDVPMLVTLLYVPQIQALVSGAAGAAPRDEGLRNYLRGVTRTSHGHFVP